MRRRSVPALPDRRSLTSPYCTEGRRSLSDWPDARLPCRKRRMNHRFVSGITDRQCSMLCRISRLRCSLWQCARWSTIGPAFCQRPPLDKYVQVTWHYGYDTISMLYGMIAYCGKFTGQDLSCYYPRESEGICSYFLPALVCVYVCVCLLTR